MRIFIISGFCSFKIKSFEPFIVNEKVSTTKGILLKLDSGFKDERIQNPKSKSHFHALSWNLDLTFVFVFLSTAHHYLLIFISCKHLQIDEPGVFFPSQISIFQVSLRLSPSIALTFLMKVKKPLRWRRFLVGLLR